MARQNIAILGLGLIGGSLAFRLRDKGYRIIGFDVTEERMQTAFHLGAIDAVAESAAAAAEGCSFIFIATPVGAIVTTVQEISSYVNPGAIVTDVGSVKRPVVEGIAAMDPPFAFIGGHPMAGSERGGILAADSNLFENAVYVLTPTTATLLERERLHSLSNLLEKDLGSNVMIMEPGMHDEVVAAVSHLPHVAAAALVNALGQTAEKVPMALALAAGGFRDTTRVASGLPELWADICLHNRAPVLRSIAYLQDELETVQEALLSQDEASLREFFAEARTLRSQVPVAQRGLIPSSFELIVPVPDMPGAISAVTSLLASVDLNLKDIAIVRQREGEVGALSISLADGRSSDRALRLLQAEGYRAYRR